PAADRDLPDDPGGIRPARAARDLQHAAEWNLSRYVEMMRSSRVVYTAITNRHARLSARPFAPDTDFICYSDIPLDRDDWKIRPIEASPYLSPRMQAKFHKLFPPEGYSWNVWV